jgi:hypothetical protein
MLPDEELAVFCRKATRLIASSVPPKDRPQRKVEARIVRRTTAWTHPGM